MTWSSDISKAPHGRYEIESRNIRGGKTADHRVFKRSVIWIATKCGKVTRSYYIPDQKRWCMLCASEAPVAWHPFDADDFDLVVEGGKQVRRYRKPVFPAHLMEAA